jgi:hypothetical protein
MIVDYQTARAILYIDGVEYWNMIVIDSNIKGYAVGETLTELAAGEHTFELRVSTQDSIATATIKAWALMSFTVQEI